MGFLADPESGCPYEIASSIRRAKGFEGAALLQISVVNPQVGPIANLRVITEIDAGNPALVELLTSWRSRYASWFFSQFQATATRTREWLRTRLAPDDSRLLFLVSSLDGVPWGHYGICWSRELGVLELDNAILGVSGVPKKLFHFVELAILNWAFRNQQIGKVIGRVFSHNTAALYLHKRVGLTIESSHDLERVEAGESVVYRIAQGEPVERVPFQLLVLGITREDFFAKYPWLA